MNKADLIQKIKQLEGVTQDERSYLINLVNTKKKYGLVWEDKPEEVEEQLCHVIRCKLKTMNPYQKKIVTGCYKLMGSMEIKFRMSTGCRLHLCN